MYSVDYTCMHACLYKCIFIIVGEVTNSNGSDGGTGEVGMGRNKTKDDINMLLTYKIC